MESSPTLWRWPLAIIGRPLWWVVAPTSTIYRSLASGADIPIEQRGQEELLTLGESRWLPKGPGPRIRPSILRRRS